MVVARLRTYAGLRHREVDPRGEGGGSACSRWGRAAERIPAEPLLVTRPIERPHAC